MVCCSILQSQQLFQAVPASCCQWLGDLAYSMWVKYAQQEHHAMIQTLLMLAAATSKTLCVLTACVVLCLQLRGSLPADSQVSGWQNRVALAKELRASSAGAVACP
jgi:hypothetical protein